MCRTWFYDLSEDPSPTFVDDILVILDDVSVISSETRQDDSGLSGDRTTLIADGRDKLLIVLGFESEQPSDGISEVKWWLRVTAGAHFG